MAPKRAYVSLQNPPRPTTEEGRLRAATAILGHALEREPTQALSEAFAARFKDCFDDEGQGWVITHKEIRDWLEELSI